MTKKDLNGKEFFNSKGDDDMLTISTSSNRITFVESGKSKEFLELLKTKKSENQKNKSRWRNISSHINK